MKPLEEAQERAQELHARYQEARNRRVAREEEIRKLRDEAAEAEAEAERRALLPDSADRGTATASETQARLREIEQEIKAREREEAEAREAWDEAKEEVRTRAREALREAGGVTERLRKAREREEEAREELGRVARAAFEEVQDAAEERREIEAAFNRLLTAADPSSVQRRAVEDHASAETSRSLNKLAAGRIVQELSWIASLSEQEVERFLAGKEILRSFR